MLNNINPAEVGFKTAYKKKIVVEIADEGLELSFGAIENQPIINAIEIRKL